MRFLIFSFILVLWLPCKASDFNKLDTIYVSTDSTFKRETGLLYTYKLIKQKALDKDIIFSFESQTISYETAIWFNRKQLRYVAFVFYDQPTGRQFLVIYDFLAKRLYKTEWYDDNATGDQLVEDKVSFKKSIVLIQENETLNTYQVKLSPIRKEKKVCVY
jgi:hypothetical protein